MNAFDWFLVAIVFMLGFVPFGYVLWQTEILPAWREYRREQDRFAIEASGKAWEQANGYTEQEYIPESVAVRKYRSDKLDCLK